MGLLQWLRRTPTSSFIKAVMVTTFVGTGGVYVAQIFAHRRVRSYPHYREAFEALANNDKAMSALGPPITVGKVDLAIANRKDQKNYAGENDSHFHIPLSGTLDAGFLDVFASRASKEDEFQTKRVQLDLENSGTYLIFEAAD